MKILLMWQTLMLVFNAAKLAVKLTANKNDDVVLEIVERLITIANKVRKGDYNIGKECTEIIALSKQLRRDKENAHKP